MVLFPLLGITWLFGLLSFLDSGLAIQYTFTVLNSFQVNCQGFTCTIVHAIKIELDLGKHEVLQPLVFKPKSHWRSGWCVSKCWCFFFLWVRVRLWVTEFMGYYRFENPTSAVFIMNTAGGAGINSFMSLFCGSSTPTPPPATSLQKKACYFGIHFMGQFPNKKKCLKSLD